MFEYKLWNTQRRHCEEGWFIRRRNDSVHHKQNHGFLALDSDGRACTTYRMPWYYQTTQSDTHGVSRGFQRVQSTYCQYWLRQRIGVDQDLTLWGRVTHICVSDLIIGWDNGLTPGRRQAIIWTNAGILLIGPLGTNFSENLIEIYTFAFEKMYL